MNYSNIEAWGYGPHRIPTSRHPAIYKNSQERANLRAKTANTSNEDTMPKELHIF